MLLDSWFNARFNLSIDLAMNAHDLFLIYSDFDLWIKALMIVTVCFGFT